MNENSLHPVFDYMFQRQNVTLVLHELAYLVSYKK